MNKQWHVFKALCARDFMVLRATIRSEIIDALILVVLQFINYVYFLPLLGMNKTLVAPLLAASIASFFINSAFDRGINDSADIAFAQFIKYRMTLPLTLTTLFIQKMSMHIVSLALVSLPSVFILLFYVRDSLTVLGLLAFWGIYFCALLWVASLIIAIAYGTRFFWFIDNIWTRVLMPILFFGCQYFSWKAAYAVSPLIGVLYALSPVTYINEGIRSALLQSDQFLPVSICALVLITISISTILLARTIFIRRLYA